MTWQIGNPNTNVAITNITSGMPTSQPKKEIPTEIVAEPIEAWRMWRVVRPQELRLTPDVLKTLSKKWVDGQNPFEGLLGAKLSGVGNSVEWPTATHDARCTAGAVSANSSFSALAMQQQVMRQQMLYGGPAPSSITNNHAVPHQTCTCGVWALNSEEMLWKTILQYDGNSSASFAYGKVQLWGRIIEHKLGYRAAHARPTELHLVRSDQDTADELAAFYGCSCDLVEMPEQVTKMRNGHLENHTHPRTAASFGYAQITTAPLITPPGAIYRMPGTGQMYQQINNTTLQPYANWNLTGMSASKVVWDEDALLPTSAKEVAEKHLEQQKIEIAKKSWRQKHKK